MKKMIIIILITLIALLSGSIWIEKTTAGVGPLYDKFIARYDMDTFYVKTDLNSEKLWNNTYRYIFIGYNKNGKKQKIVRVINRKIRPNAYLRIDAEGRYGKGWMEIDFEKIPQKAIEKLK